MSLNIIQLNINQYTSRNDLRKKVVTEFLKEIPGTGKGNQSSRYRYNVEQLSNGSWIYLKRPAFNANGFDFAIHVENMIFHESRIKTRPKHDQIFSDLRIKKQNNPKAYSILYNAIKDVYQCKDPTIVLQSLQNIQFNKGYSIEMILKLVKWLFIEQDIRYWNQSGRKMFMSGIVKP
ncbi:MAG: DNA adenine methylase [Candidatus Hodarchaeales archaeon]